MAFERANSKDLRIGLYIKLVGSWFNHPFPTNTFKIKADKELTILRSLRNIKIFFDPDRSDPDLNQPSENQEPEDWNLGNEDHNALLNEEATQPETIDEEKHQRMEAFEQRRDQLIQAEQTYSEILIENKQLMREVTGGYVKGMRKAERLLGLLGTILGNDGSLLALMNLSGANEIGDEYFYHSLNTAILSMVVARELGLTEDEIQMVGMGAMFHDVGETSVEKTTSSPKGSSSGTKDDSHKHHPIAGKRMIEKGFGVPAPSLTIILQHHERLNGSGYPQKLKGDAIHQFSKIVMIVDAYDDLCNNPDPQKSVTPYEAISSLYRKRGTEYWEEAIIALVKCLGVYPPSTIVELSDRSLGIVCTINPQDRMRPMVLLYSDNTPKNEALILNLSEDTTLTIVQSLRPSQIPHRVWNYLNPRGTIKYFALENTQGQENGEMQKTPLASQVLSQ
jgi:HD-GYP domain-containing protein (c-di-GMP phosphodiesterase class II)